MVVDGSLASRPLFSLTFFFLSSSFGPWSIPPGKVVLTTTLCFLLFVICLGLMKIHFFGKRIFSNFELVRRSFKLMQIWFCFIFIKYSNILSKVCKVRENKHQGYLKWCLVQHDHSYNVCLYLVFCGFMQEMKVYWGWGYLVAQEGK